MVVDHDKYGGTFAAKRVRDELKSLLTPQHHHVNMNDIAILLDDLDHDITQPLRDMLLHTFNTTPQMTKNTSPPPTTTS